jgi:hypothetical protein
VFVSNENEFGMYISMLLTMSVLRTIFSVGKNGSIIICAPLPVHAQGAVLPSICWFAGTKEAAQNIFVITMDLSFMVASPSSFCILLFPFSVWSFNVVVSSLFSPSLLLVLLDLQM